MTAELELLRGEVATLRAEREVRAVVTRYFRLCDDLGPDTPLDALGDCFARNASWRGLGRYREAFGEHRGREAIVAMLGSYARPRPHFTMNAHFLTAEAVEVRGDTAQGRWTLLQTSTYHDGRSDLRAAALTIGCAVEEGEWRIADFATRSLFARAVDRWSDATPIAVPADAAKEIP